MADKYTVEGKEREVEFVEWDGEADVDETEPVKVGVLSNEQEIWLRIGNRRERVVVVKADGGTWVWRAGRARFVEDDRAHKRRKSKTTGLPGAVTPPMPATVVTILVEPGETVKPGQGLVIVSAMKMETTLRAPHAGTVEAINTVVGATVKPGEVLVDIKPVQESASAP